MTSLRKMFYRNGKTNTEITSPQVCHVKDFDETLAIPMTILKLVGLRLTRRDSNFIRLCWNIFYWFEFINIFIVTWLELIQMVQTARGGSFRDAVEIFKMMPCVGYLLLAMAKSYKLVYNRQVYENLVNELRGLWPRGTVSKEEHLIIATALRNLNYVVKGYYWCNNFLLVLFLAPPFVELMKRAIGYDVPLILPFFYWFPFDPFKGVYYKIILIAQTWQAVITIWLMLCGDLLFCIFLCHITTQFDLLSVRIQKLIYVPLDEQLVATYPLGKYCKEYERNHKLLIDTFDHKYWEMKYEKEVTKIILRHRTLLRLSGDVQNMFGFSLLVNVCNSSIIICFCGFCCVIVEKWNEIAYKSFLITALSQMWLLCWYGQRLLESSAGVSDALYASGWYRASKKIRSSILIMLHRSQKNVHATTYGFSIISLASYATIIKTAWSYFTLLLNIYKK